MKTYTGNVFNNTAFPVDLEHEQNSIGPRKGESKSSNVLMLVAWGDSSVDAAAEDGGIHEVNHIDARLFNILGIYSYYETIVYGE